MLNFNKKKSVIGIDIGSKCTKIAQLSFNGSNKPVLERCDFLEAGALNESFAANLKSYLQQSRLGHSLVAASFDNETIKIRRMELPKMPHADAIEAIKWNLRDIVDGNIDDFTVDYSVISESESEDNPLMELVVYAVNKNEVFKYKAELERFGLHPFMIEPAAVTLASSLERCHRDDDYYQAGLDIGHQQTIFYVIGKGVFVFSRPLKAINLELNQKDAENFPKTLAIELQKSIDTFSVNFKMAVIKTLYLSGGGALIPGIADYLKTNLGIETKTLNPFQSLTGTERFAEAKPELFAQAIGLAYLQP